MKRFVFLPFLWLFSLSVGDCAADANGYFMYADFCCAAHSRDPTQVEYLVDWFFNEEHMMQYNSTVGLWTGFTPAGLITAHQANENKGDLLQRKMERQRICVNNFDVFFTAIKENMAEPNVTLVKTTTSSHGTVFVCSAHDFYPRYIRVTWHLNGQDVTTGVTFSDVLTNGDWTYQVHSFLEYTPERRDTVSCVVEHTSLKEPKIYDWDASLSQSDRSYLIGGVCALLLGAVILSAGLIHHRKKRCDPRFSSAL